jgi:uncharacterized protein YndB with AHSA1/START domain
MTEQLWSAVRRTITVATSQQRAFEVFTANFGAWWPKDYHLGPATMVDFILEPKAGGRWYELDEDGSQCDAGHVLAYEPPHRLVLAWQLNEQWQYDADLSHASEVEVRFVAEGPSRTRIELEHRGFERHGAGAAAVRASMDDPTAWTYVMELFAQQFAA